MPGLRVESVDLLKNNSQSAEIRKALVYALEHDPNAGVRLKALDGLKQFAEDPDTRQALTQRAAQAMTTPECGPR